MDDFLIIQQLDVMDILQEIEDVQNERRVYTNIDPFIGKYLI